MPRRNFFILICFLVLALCVRPTVSALSLESVGSRVKKVVSTKEQRKEVVKEQIQQRKCEVVGNLIHNRVNRFSENKSVHVENYTRVKEKLTEIMEKLGNEGLDVSDLRADLVTFDEMLKEYTQLYTSFIAELEASGEVVCGDSNQPFRDLLSRSKDSLEELRAKRQEIRQFYAHTLREDIKELREQAQALSTEEE